jgi:hypothetical protein
MAHTSWIRRSWNGWPPGLAVAMSGLAAALFPLVASEHMSTREKFFWASSFAFLVILESWAILKERSKTERATADQMRSLEALRAASDANHNALLRMLLDRFSPVDDLKTRALILSEAILDFVYQRLQDAPKKPTDFFSYERNNRTLVFDTIFDQSSERMATLQYENETARIFKERFTERAKVIVAEMARRGLNDDALDGLLSTPPKLSWITSMMTELGERLGQLAERITAVDVEALDSK